MPDQVSVTTTDLSSNMAGRASRYLIPEKFSTDPSASEAELQWNHWLLTFENFISEEARESEPSLKYKILTNFLAPSVFALIKNFTDYNEALKALQGIYVKPKNRILARHILSTRQQKSDESISDYGRALKLLAQDCDFKCVTADQYKNEFICNAFISGIQSQKIRQRLLENMSLSYDEALNQALTLETAEKSLQSFNINNSILPNQNSLLNAVPNILLENKNRTDQNLQIENNLAATNISPKKRRCFFCGGNIHQRIKCPAFHATCQLCSRKGHFANVCRSSRSSNTTTSNAISSEVSTSATIIAASPGSLQKATILITINNHHADALVDTGSSVSFISKDLVETLRLKIRHCSQTITLASLSHTSIVEGICWATIEFDKYIYKQRPLLIVNNLCADVIIGHDILRRHESVVLNFGGEEEPLNICNLMEVSVPPASLFSNLSPDIKPIAMKSRRYSGEEEAFITQEINQLLKDGIIQDSMSPWRAQVLIAGGGHHRKRLVIDYSRTINRFTELDAFPLPKIETIISKVANYTFFSQIDLKSAYHQIPILKKEQKYTAFEANNKLYEFTRIPFGVTNGVAAFQRSLQFIIDKEQLSGTFAYLDDVTICGHTKEEHDINLNRFMRATEKYKLTLNKDKCVFGTQKINLLGHTISNRTISPDMSRVQTLLDLPIPKDAQSLKKALGLFAHYSPWIKDFSHKIRPLIDVAYFPLSVKAVSQFELLKNELAKSSLHAIDFNATFTVETDASEYAVGAILSQDNHPVAYYSRSLSASEKRHSSIEKEACAIVEALRRWRHYLLGRHFILITDQKSVAFMLSHHTSKIKNDKIERWRLELSSFKFDIQYRPGNQNTAADALSRVCAHVHTNVMNELYKLHNDLGHPGVVRMMHWVRTKNLPYSVNDIRTVISSCKVCAEIKPRFYNSQGKLIKATSPFERLSIDFKGPIPSCTKNKYFLTIIDEYSRFPFAYPCQDTSAESVIKCLTDLFCMFGTPQFVHSDRGSAFMSEKVQQFLTSLGIACSRTCPYNPQGNGQVERLNGTLWRTIQLFLKSKEMLISEWEKVLPIALHSIRSLLCTATNSTPHERLFYHSRRSMNGKSMPTWLTSSGTALMRKYVRTSKYDPLVEEVEIVQANPSYSFIRYQDGREATVSNRDLAPLPSDDDTPDTLTDTQNTRLNPPDMSTDGLGNPVDIQTDSTLENNTDPTTRTSNRVKRPPRYLADYVQEN